MYHQFSFIEYWLNLLMVILRSIKIGEDVFVNNDLLSIIRISINISQFSDSVPYQRRKMYSNSACTFNTRKYLKILQHDKIPQATMGSSGNKRHRKMGVFW